MITYSSLFNKVIAYSSAPGERLMFCYKHLFLQRILLDKDNISEISLFFPALFSVNAISRWSYAWRV